MDKSLPAACLSLEKQDVKVELWVATLDDGCGCSEYLRRLHSPEPAPRLRAPPPRNSGGVLVGTLPDLGLDERLCRLSFATERAA